MSAIPTEKDATSRGLEALLMRELSETERPMRHATQRLQPVVLPPPPTARAATGQASSLVTPEDDIALDLDDDASQRRWQLMLAAIGVGIAGAGMVGWLIYASIAPAPQISAAPRPQPAVVAPPEAAAPPPDSVIASVPAAPPGSGAPTDGRQAPEVSMADVSSELVPPSTEGLSPARKVTTVRILVENDREVARAP